MVYLRMDKPPVLVLAVNPWMSGKLWTYARKYGFNVKKMWVLRNPPPWSKYREHEAGASESQREIWEKFASINKEYAGLPLGERLAKVRELMKGRRVREITAVARR